MTDRFHSLTVALTHDLRDDDAQALIDAISLLRGVLAVSGNVRTADSFVAQSRAKREMEQRLWGVIKEGDEP